MPYLDYLLREALPTDKTEARWLACHAKSFAIIDGELYRWCHTGILQCYIPIEQGKQLLSDIHCRVCGHHSTSRSHLRNAEHIVRTYKGCQYYAR